MIKVVWDEMRQHGHHPGCGYYRDECDQCDCGFEAMHRLINNDAAMSQIENVQKSDGTVICDIIDRLQYARSKHAQPTFAALIEEVGEVAKDMNECRNPRNELIDVATVAIRLCNESWG